MTKDRGDSGGGSSEKTLGGTLGGRREYERCGVDMRDLVGKKKKMSSFYMLYSFIIPV